MQTFVAFIFVGAVLGAAIGMAWKDIALWQRRTYGQLKGVPSDLVRATRGRPFIATMMARA